MGAVYEVRDLERGANLALKTLLDTRSERLLDLKSEFRALQDLTHPNLVRLDELFESDGLWFFTMERIRGTPFSSFVRPCGLDPERLRRSLKDLAHGLLALHGADKIHRDVKPSNTLVERVVGWCCSTSVWSEIREARGKNGGLGSVPLRTWRRNRRAATVAGQPTGTAWE